MTDKQQLSVPARIVVVESVYHQQDPDPATVVESRFSRFLTSDSTPLIRRTKVGEDWAPLCCAGIEYQGSMLVIHNLEGRLQSRVPTEEEKVVMESRVLEIGGYMPPNIFCPDSIITGFAYIRPGESMRIPPANLADYRIRCMLGQARYSLALFPV